MKPLPRMVTTVPPTVPPPLGLTAADARGQNSAVGEVVGRRTVEDVPDVVVTVTSMVPGMGRSWP